MHINKFLSYKEKYKYYSHEILDAEEGPEFDMLDAGGKADVLLVVNPIREVLGIPKENASYEKVQQANKYLNSTCINLQLR